MVDQPNKFFCFVFRIYIKPNLAGRLTPSWSADGAAACKAISPDKTKIDIDKEEGREL